MKLADIIAPEFIEHRVLPVVMAFGLGVLISGVAHDAEREIHRSAALAQIKEARRSAVACEQLLEGTAPAQLAAAQEVRP